MSFESGSVSFRLFYLPQPLPRNHLERFAAFVVPPLTALRDTPLHGWVGGRHLLDRTIDEHTAHYAGYLRVTLMRAARKIPESLLRAECQMEGLARLQATGQPELDRKTRSAIRKEISERLLPPMPPQLKGMTLVHQPESDWLCAEVLSEKQFDAFEAGFRQTFGFGPIPVTPLHAAAKRRKLDVRQLPATSFSPDCDDDSVTDSIGQDFLTWLWFFSEVKGGMARLGDLGEFGVMVEGPLLFVLEGNGAHETVLRRGFPLLSAEAKTALQCGKKLKRAHVILARGQEAWRVTVDADEFIFRGLRLPEADKLDAVSRFQQRLTAITLFKDAFLALYDRFLDQRADAKAWPAVRNDIHRWVSDRTARK